ncbi:uncharacterized protein LOC126750172 [Anthonomus grandis grandis]|uniref:uncharacterized protein LOC126750172 n=1 Tax=Anthonomus grandis grandis TaxID=2921223 RepID=UPI0021651212|nr:uncharacterized protein LOC126750172 [Anthonomus grandis grandis]
MKYLKVGFVFLGLVVSKYANGFSYCKNDDPNFDTCLAKGIEDAVKSFKSGSSELGLKPIDPLPVDKITLGSGGGAVNLVQYYDGVSVHGLTNIKVTKAHYDKSKKTLAIENVFPKLSQKGHYKVNGAILSLPVQGDGQSTLDLENCEIKLTLQLSEDTIGGEKYFKIESCKASIKVQMLFENLFNGNKL